MLIVAPSSQALNDSKRLATSGANFARSRTVTDGTCAFPNNASARTALLASSVCSRRASTAVGGLRERRRDRLREVPVGRPEAGVRGHRGRQGAWLLARFRVHQCTCSRLAAHGSRVRSHSPRRSARRATRPRSRRSWASKRRAVAASACVNQRDEGTTRVSGVKDMPSITAEPRPARACVVLRWPGPNTHVGAFAVLRSEQRRLRLGLRRVEHAATASGKTQTRHCVRARSQRSS